MSVANDSPISSEWRKLASLGEQLVGATSLSAQQDRIILMTSRLVDGRVDLWLDDGLFRLPDRESAPLFTVEPPPGGLHRAWKTGQICLSKSKKKAWVALPIADQGVVMGALQHSIPRNWTSSRDYPPSLRSDCLLRTVLQWNAFASNS
jgi:hypothetical protein